MFYAQCLLNSDCTLSCLRCPVDAAVCTFTNCDMTCGLNGMPLDVALSTSEKWPFFCVVGQWYSEGRIACGNGSLFQLAAGGLSVNCSDYFVTCCICVMMSLHSS